MIRYLVSRNRCNQLIPDAFRRPYINQFYLDKYHAVTQLCITHRKEKAMEYDSLARAIQSFHQAEVERYEHELKKFRETAGRLEASRKQREAQLRDFFVASNLSVDQLKKGEEESQEYLTQFLTEVRPALANQEPKGAQPSLDRARIIDAHAPNGRTLNVAAATLLAP